MECNRWRKSHSHAPMLLPLLHLPSEQLVNISTRTTHAHPHTHIQTNPHTHTRTHPAAATFYTHRTSLTFKHVSRACLVSCSCCLNYIHHIYTLYTLTHAYIYMHIYAYISAWISAYLTACHTCVYPAVFLSVHLLFLLLCSLSD